MTKRERTLLPVLVEVGDVRPVEHVVKGRAHAQPLDVLAQVLVPGRRARARTLQQRVAHLAPLRRIQPEQPHGGAAAVARAVRVERRAVQGHDALGWGARRARAGRHQAAHRLADRFDRVCIGRRVPFQQCAQANVQRARIAGAPVHAHAHGVLVRGEFDAAAREPTPHVDARLRLVHLAQLAQQWRARAQPRLWHARVDEHGVEHRASAIDLAMLDLRLHEHGVACLAQRAHLGHLREQPFHVLELASAQAHRVVVHVGADVAHEPLGTQLLHELEAARAALRGRLVVVGQLLEQLREPHFGLLCEAAVGVIRASWRGGHGRRAQ